MSFKGIVHPKFLILSLITLVAIVYLQNTNEDIFDEIRELSRQQHN